MHLLFQASSVGSYSMCFEILISTACSLLFDGWAILVHNKLFLQDFAPGEQNYEHVTWGKTDFRNISSKSEHVNATRLSKGPAEVNERTRISGARFYCNKFGNTIYSRLKSHHFLLHEFSGRMLYTLCHMLTQASPSQSLRRQDQIWRIFSFGAFLTVISLDGA